MSEFLKQPLSSLNRVGATLAKRCKKIGLENNLDLLLYFPFRYEDYSKVVKIDSLQPDQQVTIKGIVEIIHSRRSWMKRMMITEAVIRDETEGVKAIWFNQPYLAKIIQAGDEIYISGKTSEDRLGLVFKNPEYEKAKEKTTHTARLVPIYPLTQGITEKQIRYLISQVLEKCPDLSDWLPNEIIKKYNLLNYSEALRQIHFPDSLEQLEQSKKRLSFDELLLVRLYNLQSRDDLNQRSSPQIIFQEKAIKNFVNSLSFSLTSSQKKCAWQIIKDLEKKQPMNRLLEGDVGSGKTVVAALAMFNTALNGFQAVLMAPTEILAEQHYQTISKIIGSDTVSLITRSKKNITKDHKIIIGTHALLENKIKFNRLGLVIIDEQHRFGVKQRQALQNKSGLNNLMPHLLSLTATPIPRTLALTAYGDLDLSVISEMPQGRKKILTKLVQEDKRNKAYEFIRQKIKAGDQAFVICPLISESDKLGVKSVETEFEHLNKNIFPDLKIAKLHGKLKAAEKEIIMADFKNNNYNILVSTSVIEVGVDIPNATIMIIEGAERFGLAQLHQFRGRVGRSNKQSYCLLFTNNSSVKTTKRLEALTKSQNGFKLAEYDLKLRGAGSIYGQEQSGYINTFKIANLNDSVLIAQTQQAANEIFSNLNQYPEIQEKINNFQAQVHWE